MPLNGLDPGLFFCHIKRWLILWLKVIRIYHVLDFRMSGENTQRFDKNVFEPGIPEVNGQFIVLYTF